MIIRAYTTKDIPTIIQFNDLLQDHLAEIDTSGRIIRKEGYGKRFTHLLIQKLQKQRGMIFVAEDPKIGVMGMATAYCVPQTRDDLLWSIPLKQGKITGVFVREEFRGKHIGMSLIKYAEKYLRGEGCKQVHILASASNRAGLDFYKKLGYEPESIEIYKRL